MDPSGAPGAWFGISKSSESVSNVRRCHSERSEESVFEHGKKQILRLRASE